ncbi:hypothetical protein SOV_17210 [Sporomusa ovata DSM 2662]|uniref:Uncharacterized protein n=1 Tax=Sporomusa ovata TaxID=2378 RepID=A0A0U1KVA0_9FIRM|nr:hypothetical protein [Sporomusa ovata]EQB29321.1 hypothetical protein SOV_1c10540 [Sporomusa ovata DSM 2662]CQR71362.1 hypothetical protein SpAn4DRAFT_3867 [Sporomusa ovata]
MPAKTRAAARKTKAAKCIEFGNGVGVIMDPALVAIEPVGESNHSECRSIKPSSEEFARMLETMPNADRVKPVVCPLKKRKPVFDFRNMTGKPGQCKKV